MAAGSPEEAAASAVVRDEAARQAVILAFGVLSVVLMVWVQRHAADPDWFRSQRMRSAKVSERLLARLAGWSWQRAERARLAYESERA